eukprot:gene2949-3234_t
MQQAMALVAATVQQQKQRSSFCMSDLKGIKPFADGKHLAAGKDVVIS